MFSRLLVRSWGILRTFALAPGRLAPSFPWTLTKSAKTYGIALLLYIVASVLPAIAITAILMAFAKLSPQSLEWLFHESTYKTFVVAMTIFLFVCGFSAQVWYLSRSLKREQLSVRKVVGLNCDTLSGKWWNAVALGICTYVVMMGIDILLGLIFRAPAHDPAAEFLNSLSGWHFAAVTVLVVVGPVFEEIVFRGFLFNMVRSSLWKDTPNARLIANLAGICVSAVAFAVLHFNVAGLASYFIFGALLADAYRRSGSLYVPIVAHCLNNLTAVVLILML